MNGSALSGEGLPRTDRIWTLKEGSRLRQGWRFCSVSSSKLLLSGGHHPAFWSTPASSYEWTYQLPALSWLCPGYQEEQWEVCCVSCKWWPAPHPHIQIWESLKGSEDLICDYNTLEILVTPGSFSAFPSKSFKPSHLVWLCSVIVHPYGFHNSSR